MGKKALLLLSAFAVLLSAPAVWAAGSPPPPGWPGPETGDPLPSDCPAQKVLGKGSPDLNNLRAFRDGPLAQSAVGRRIIEIYYDNAGSVNEALENSPALRESARKVLEMIAPMVGKN